MSLTVACPNCKRPVAWGPESPFRPFCSERCRLIDLGDWFDETHRIPGPPQDDWSDNGSDNESDHWPNNRPDEDPDAANGEPRLQPH